MFERIGEVLQNIGSTVSEQQARIHQKWSQQNPDLYSESDARRSLKLVGERDYLFGSDQLNPRLNIDRSKIWSLTPEQLETIKNIIKKAHHVHIAPFVMGTYNMVDQSMRMNDLCLSDPWMGYLIAKGGLEGFTMPVLRGIYYAGRPSWWRHESIHARHHHQMAYFLDATDPDTRGHAWKDQDRMSEAMYTVHESGIEELVTRWQALKEAPTLREKTMSTLALLLYMEYAPFTGLRNAFIDGKEATLDLIKDGKLRIPAKFAFLAGLMYLPLWANSQTHWIQNTADLVANATPIPKDNIEDAVYRGLSYIDVAAISSMFSSKEKGAFGPEDEDGRPLSTTEYKFPYVYNPVSSTARSVGLLMYLSRTWDQIPNFRQINSPADIDLIKREIDERLELKLGDRQRAFTMNLVEDALEPYEGQGRSSFPQQAFIKGMFTPALYLRLREMYNVPQEVDSQGSIK